MDLSTLGPPTVIEPGLDATLDPALEAELRIIRAHGPIQLEQAARDIIPSSRMSPLEFLDALSETERMDVFHACLLVFKLSRGAIVPRVFQLQAPERRCVLLYHCCCGPMPLELHCRC
jgi:hypothetical protein